MIKVIDITKRFPDGGKAIEGVSLDIKDGEFFSIVGPSGCGKTTLLRIIAGLEEISSGTVEAPGNLAMVFQAGALFPWQTALDNVTFGLRMRGVKHASEVGTEKLQEVGLQGLESRHPRELSGGQRQRVGVARALAVDPTGLLLDEPFSALDEVTTRSLHKDLLRIWQAHQKTIVLVSHSIEEAVELSDRVAVMSGGKLLKIVEVNLPRPRERVDKLFKIVSEIEKLLS